jgi:hypothetical protein
MKLMRTVSLPVLLVLLAGLCGCVVPVGPEWTDPQGNYPPTIHSATPPVGSVLGLDPDAGAALAVAVVLADHNTKDKLYVRFIIDYPPFDANVTRLAWSHIEPGGGQIERPTITFAPNCIDDQIARGFTSHRLLLAASDRPFASDNPTEAAPDAVADGNFLVEAMWQFEMDCQ